MLGGGVDILWLLGADELDTNAIGANTFVIYQGHTGDAGAARADLILPGWREEAAFTRFLPEMTVVLPEGTWTDLVHGGRYAGEVPLAQLLAELPVVLLAREA